MTSGGARILVVTCDWSGREAPETLLGGLERAHAARLTGPRRAEWVRTRLTAKAAVGWATGDRGAQILPDPDGAPRVLDAPSGAAVSLSHSGDLAVCAVTRAGPASTLGVDVEPVDARNDVLLPRLLGPRDPLWTGPGRLPDPLPPGFVATVLAACKEAALKAYRRPSPALRHYRLGRGPDGGLWARADGSALGALRVRWSCQAGRVIAVCAAGHRTPVYEVVSVDRVLAAFGGRVRTGSTAPGVPGPAGNPAPGREPGQRRMTPEHSPRSTVSPFWL
ncbi:4'-phosphopantetheinyl transferase EntD [Streptomyces sp. LBL]|uniref:4'-phosphopantetheinyl transferase family protein n=1 Tax=Streptomyces sp. LBL TaxID=2940562 RepID=UPI00247416C7|nr:hypothetical protein [Streptomyces sp. LBL]MDH6623213.1 4'-phosphopantetheinyl transferase EntD [Streptomyces sp. LBL]